MITNENVYIKLPKLYIKIFYSDCTQFTTFWNTFKTSIYENKTPAKIEIFHYLKSYLSGAAANAIISGQIQKFWDIESTGLKRCPSDDVFLPVLSDLATRGQTVDVTGP